MNSDGPTRKGLVSFFTNAFIALLMTWMAFYVETVPGLEWMFAPCAFTGLFNLCVGLAMLLFTEEVDD